MAHNVNSMGGILYYYVGQSSTLELYMVFQERETAGRTKKGHL